MRRLMVCFCLVFGLLAGVAGATPDARQAMRDLEQAVASHDVTGICAAIQALGEVGSRQAVQAIIQVGCNTDQLGDLDPRDSLRVFDAAKRTLAAVTDPEAVEIIRHEATRNRAWQVQVMLVQVMAIRAQDADWDVVIEALQSRVQHVQRAAIRAISDARLARAIDALIDVVAATERAGDLVWVDANQALTHITGQEFGSANDWRNWWEPNRARFNPANVQEGQGGVRTGSGTRSRTPPPELFGEEILSKRVVFIIDISGSMEEVDPPPAGGGETSGGNPGGGSTTGGRPGQQGGNPGGTPPPFDPNDESRRRITRAKLELIRVVQALEPDVRFTIIAYSDRLVYMDGSGGGLAEGQDVPPPNGFQLTTASASGKREAIQFVESLHHGGTTWTDAALRAAFLYEEANTIYLVSDGAPTHDGMTMLNTQGILDEVRELNRLRNVQIHALCFPGANHQFMGALATQNGGNHRDIP